MPFQWKGRLWYWFSASVPGVACARPEHPLCSLAQPLGRAPTIALEAELLGGSNDPGNPKPAFSDNELHYDYLY